MDIVIKKIQGSVSESPWRSLLAEAGLTADSYPEETVLIYEGDELAATGSIDGSILKYLAVANRYQGEGLTGKLMTELRNLAFQKGRGHLFLYTKPKNIGMFTPLLFYKVAETGDVLLMESVRDGVSRFVSSLPKKECEGKISAIVMNCDPFTLGHRYLVEKASRESDLVYLFILSEDRSFFSTEDRKEMVRRGTADLSNVVVSETGPYLISSATFPDYFLKNVENAGTVQCELDVEIFAVYFAKAFGITRRYVGTEPLSNVTEAYNKVLREKLPQRGIEVVEVERKNHGEDVISASKVRRLLQDGNLEEVKDLVPESTYLYICEKK